MAEQQFAFRMDQLRLHVFEIDALNSLLNVQIPLHAGRRIGAVPIERPESRITILLDFVSPSRAIRLKRSYATGP